MEVFPLLKGDVFQLNELLSQASAQSPWSNSRIHLEFVFQGI